MAVKRAEKNKKSFLGGERKMDLSYQEITDLAIFLAIDLDNLRRGKIKSIDPEAIEKLKQWLLSAVEIYGRQENFWSGRFDPTTAVAFNDLLADFFQLPKCQYLSELGKRLREAVGLIVFSNEGEINRLKDFCLKLSQKFLELDFQEWGHHYLAA